MDPGRQAMIASGGSPRRRDATSPRTDPRTRVRKPAKGSASAVSQGKARFLTEDEQARRFVADEDTFVLKQAKKKADIRVREHRADPIDYLAFNLRYVDPDRDMFDGIDADVEIEVSEPLEIVNDLSAAELSALESAITSYHVLEKNARNRDYWAALKTLCANKRARMDPQAHEERVIGSVTDDIDNILSRKSLDELEALEKQIRDKLQSNDDIDTDYWEQLARSIQAWKAKATLQRIQSSIADMRAKALSSFRERTAGNPAPPPPLQRKVADERTSLASRSHKASSKEAQPGPSPAAPVSREAPPPGTERFSQPDESHATDALYDREAARGVSENEEVFAAEETVPNQQKPQWTTKYRPRRPRYFNRVQMGYEWNKYNQTHYDHSNPPPKVVQGYKFNIFYPELIDKTKAPTFRIIREHGRKRGESFAAAGEEDTCLIHFMAGPPYEDIAFRIVDREWDYSAKRERGFKSSFDKVRRASPSK